MLHNVYQYLVEHGPAIVAFLLMILPSVANGLSAYPRAQHALHVIIDLLSWTTRKDSPGTFKAPFTRSLPPVQ